MIRLLTENRKAAIFIFIGSHSDRLKSLEPDGPAHNTGDFGQWEEHKAYQKAFKSEILKG
jgi:hypothetical protein